MSQHSLQVPLLPVIRATLFTLMVAAVLAGCAMPGDRVPDNDAAAYREVADAVARNDCAAARRAVEAMKSRHPDSRRLPDAYLESGYVCLGTGDLEAAEVLVEDFLERFPSHPSEDYGHYLSALAAYARWRALPPEAPGAHSADQAREAFGRFRLLLTAHPDTAYGSDVRPLLMELREGLARVELTAIRNDLDARRHDAVVPRARYLLTHYGNTESAPYAMAALVSAHRALGESAQARRLLQQLESDWPDHPVLDTLGPEPRDG